MHQQKAGADFVVFCPKTKLRKFHFQHPHNASSSRRKVSDDHNILLRMSELDAVYQNINSKWLPKKSQIGKTSKNLSFFFDITFLIVFQVSKPFITDRERLITSVVLQNRYPSEEVLYQASFDMLK